VLEFGVGFQVSVRPRNWFFNLFSDWLFYENPSPPDKLLCLIDSKLKNRNRKFLLFAEFGYFEKVLVKGP
jgi:hypothetical protein